MVVRNEINMIFIIIFILMVSLSTSAQTPLDTLESFEEEKGDITYTFDLNYVPENSTIWLEHGNSLFEHPVSENNWEISCRIDYQITRNLKLNLKPELIIYKDKIYRDKFQDEVIEKNNGSEKNILAGLDYRLNSEHKLEPVLGITYEYPENVGFSISGNYITDPVILFANLGINKNLSNSSYNLDLTYGTGFIANQKINFKLIGSNTFDINNEFENNITSFTLQTGYYLKPEAKEEIALRNTVIFRDD